jgi:transposase InsO family protein
MATARPGCDALAAAMARHDGPSWPAAGDPDRQWQGRHRTDNGKVVTAPTMARSSPPGSAPDRGRCWLTGWAMLVDRLCHEHGIRQLLTAPSSPTTTGKIERLHKSMRREFFDRQVFVTIETIEQA